METTTLTLRLSRRSVLSSAFYAASISTAVLDVRSIISSTTATALPEPTLEALETLPDFLMTQFKSAPYIEMALALQRLGREEATSLIRSIAVRVESEGIAFVLCRMLYKKRRGKPFPEMSLGGVRCFGGTRRSDWPLCPVTIVEGVPFVITTGYASGGASSVGADYVEYCSRNCDWNSSPFRMKSRVERERANKRLLRSKVWRRPLTPEETHILKQQAE